MKNRQYVRRVRQAHRNQAQYKKGSAGIGALIVVVALVAAGGYFVLHRGAPAPEPTPIVIETPDPVLNPTPTEPATSQNPTHIPQAHNTFGFETIKLLAKDEGNNNIFISPSSIALALSMVYNGAGGTTKDAMQKALQFQGLDISTINQESLGLINLLKNPDPQVELSVANSLWARNGVEFKKEFLTTVASYFKAQIATLDFNAPSAADTINAWVSSNTKGKIPSIVASPIPNDMVMYLINAVYFKGSWTKAFEKKLTENKTFTAAGGTAKKAPLMKKVGYLPYFETEEFQSVALSYGKNKRLSMYVFLPKDLTAFVQTLDEKKWTEWMNQYEEMSGTLFLPRFKMEYEKGLIPALTSLGMGVAFGNGADLSGMGKDLKISEVKHKTYVDVNEEGTEAAAVTSVGIGVTSVAPPVKTFTMEVNHPFFFAIRDSQTGEVLFMGTVQHL
ncbi:MAG: serpin family protein [bacterium]|nr:serpin family protein [bacterium]